ncbi:MAG: hypothetical protein ACOX1Y_13830 [Zhaonellaceae bacterium]
MGIRICPASFILKEKIVASFARKLGVEFEKGGLLPYEKKLLAEKLPKFKSESWINKIKKHSASDKNYRIFTSEMGA